jgi:hypothetical protein
LTRLQRKGCDLQTSMLRRHARKSTQSYTFELDLLVQKYLL